MKEVKTYLFVCILIGIGFVKLELDKENLEAFQLVLCTMIGVVGGIFGLGHMVRARKQMSMGVYCLPFLGGVILALASLASCDRGESRADPNALYYDVNIFKKEKRGEEYLVYYSRDFRVPSTEPDTFIAKMSLVEFQKYQLGHFRMKDTILGEPIHKPDHKIYEYRIDGRTSKMGYKVLFFGPMRRYYKLPYTFHEWPHGEWYKRSDFNASKRAWDAHAAGKTYREKELPEDEGLVW